MKKRFAKLAAILLSSAMTLTMIPTNFVYAKDVDTTAVQTEATDDRQDESGKITIPVPLYQRTGRWQTYKSSV